MGQRRHDDPLEAPRLAFGLLTVFPVSSKRASTRTLGEAVAYFPLVGLAVGAAAGGLGGLVAGLAPHGLAAVIAVGAIALLTGGLHLDGLADTADGLGGGRGDRARTLEIMRDSRVGSFGVIALVLVLAGKIVAVNALYSEGGSAARVLWSLMLACATGRWCAALAIRRFDYARKTGLGRAFREGARKKEMIVATAILIAALLVGGIGGWWAVAVAGAFTLIFGGWVQARLGGLTGDVYGVIVETGETIFLAVMVAGV